MLGGPSLTYTNEVDHSRSSLLEDTVGGQQSPVSTYGATLQLGTIQSSDSQLRWGSDFPIFTFGGELALSQHGELRTESTPTVEIRSTGMAIVPHSD